MAFVEACTVCMLIAIAIAILAHRQTGGPPSSDTARIEADEVEAIYLRLFERLPAELRQLWPEWDTQSALDFMPNSWVPRQPCLDVHRYWGDARGRLVCVRRMAEQLVWADRERARCSAASVRQVDVGTEHSGGCVG
ncbi:hypothetical protein SCP_1700170 [Sparassis crispa]|uniref:Uncharacterized protein n=1 Tax=Sparassis crispa TaxID=139825 RepID=A0A401H5M9_9APHY|nr:hypothetical protein SCP_1700170 [Sparassis crispa]GBE89693.1 hypothetical protein SCP_1700170 [Sparassis crispa]